MKLRIKALMAVIFTALALMAGMLTAPSALALDGVQYSNGYWSQCLVQNSITQWHQNFAPTYIYSCVDTWPDQRWAHLSNYQLWNYGTQGCLNGDTTRAYQNYPCDGAGHFDLVPIIGFDGGYLIRSRDNPVYCLAAPWWNGGSPLFTPCNGGWSDQRWYPLQPF